MQVQGANKPPVQHLARPSANTLFMAGNATYICGINSSTLLQRDSQAERIAGEVFNDEFMSCMDKAVKKLENDLKSYSALMASNGQIRLNTGQKKMLKHSSIGLDTSTVWELIPIELASQYQTLLIISRVTSNMRHISRNHPG